MEHSVDRMALDPTSATQTDSDDTFTVVVRGQPFYLDEAQITFDSPNLLTDSFLGDFAEASSRRLKLNSHPDLFAIIADYLSGYPVLPLRPAMVPRGMDVELATRYLAKDADYLGLTRLQSLLVPAREASQAFRDWIGAETYSVDLVDVLNDCLPASVQWRDLPSQGHQLVSTAEGGKPVLITARNVALRFLSGTDYDEQGNAISTGRNVARITHLDGVRELPLIYGEPDNLATLAIDDHEPIFVQEHFPNDFSNTTGRAGKHWAQILRSGAPKELWADSATFRAHGRDLQYGNRRYWDLRLLSARAKTRTHAIDKALEAGGVAKLQH